MEAKTKLLIALLLAASLVTVITALANTVYLPQVPKEATYTPTLTQTATLTPVSSPTRTPTPTRTPEPTDLYISDLLPDPDDSPLNEWIEITNNGNNDVDMEGWSIKSETGPLYEFPDNFTLDEDDSVKVWTRIGQNSSTNLYWGLTSPVWDDNHGNAYLKDPDGETVDEYEY